MSLNQIFACSLIMKELFGEVVEKVGTYLIKKGPMLRGLIVQDTELNVEQVGLYTAFNCNGAFDNITKYLQRYFPSHKNWL